jgi:Secretion system C-terminal sorting domain
MIYVCCEPTQKTMRFTKTSTRRIVLSSVLGLGLVSSLNKLTAQNIIQNPSFDIGQIVTGHGQITKATGWTFGCGNQWTNVSGVFANTTPDLYDDNSTSIAYDVPLNNTGGAPSLYSQDGDGRFVGFYGQEQNNPQSGWPQLAATTYGESILGTLTSTLNAGCTYNISFWAAHDATMGSSVPNLVFAPHPNLIIQAVLRKNGNCTAEKVVYTTGAITSTNWTNFAGTFTLTAADAAVGYDRIEFRVPLLPYASGSNNVHVDIDNTSLTASPVPLPNILNSQYYCSGSPVTVSPSFSGTATNHTWQITQSNSAGVPTPGGYTWTSNLINGNPVVYTFPNSSTIPCNTYYNVTLTVNAPCGTVTKSKVIHVRCTPTPVITSNQTNPLCFGESATLSVNYTPSPGTSVTWSTGATSQSITVNPTATSTTYSVTVNVNGCGATATYTITRNNNNNPAFTLNGSATSGNPYFSVSATPLINPGTFGINYYWEVVEINPITNTEITGTKVYNPSCWWTGNGITSFQNYNYLTTYTNANNGLNDPNNFGCSTTTGRFESNSTYRFTRATWTSNCAWVAEVQTIMMCPTCRMPNGNQLVVLSTETFDSENIPENMEYLRTAIGAQQNALPVVNIFPNPSNGAVNISFETDGEKQIQIYDATGKLIAEQQAVNQFISLDLSSQPAGLYLCRIITSAGIVTKHIIIE